MLAGLSNLLASFQVPSVVPAPTAPSIPTPIQDDTDGFPFTRYIVVACSDDIDITEEVVASRYEVNSRGDLHLYVVGKSQPIATYFRGRWQRIKEADASDN